MLSILGSIIWPLIILITLLPTRALAVGAEAKAISQAKERNLKNLIEKNKELEEQLNLK